VITLYGPSQAPYTEKVRRALIYKGYEFELVEPTTPEDYKRFSPKTGQLPVLDLDGESVPDSTEILMRLDEIRPEPPLLSSDPTVAAQQRQLEEWADESLLYYYLKYRRLVGDEEQVMPVADGDPDPPGSSADLEQDDSGSGPLRRIAAWFRAGGTWERPHMGVVRQIGDRMDDLVNFLGARPFFYSDKLSMADLGVYSMLAIMREGSIPGAARLIASRPSLVAFMQRVEEQTGGAKAA
jgi:glutathione S-transferase